MRVTGGWEEDDYGHDDLVIEEYTKASIGSSWHFTVDWKHGEKATANYFIYHTNPRSEQDMVSGEPEPPSLEELESLENPPPPGLSRTTLRLLIPSFDGTCD